MDACHGRAARQNDTCRVVDALPGLVWTALPDGYVDFLNQRWGEYTGLSVAEIAGWGWLKAVHPDDESSMLERWTSLLASGEPNEMEARLRRFDGEYRWFLFRTCRFADSFGKLVNWCGMGTDIHDQRQGEKSFSADEHRSHLIIDGLPTMVTLRSPTGELEFANRHYLEYFDATLGEAKTWKRGHTFHPDERPQVVAAFQRSIETGLACSIEARRRRADGVYRWFHMHGFPLRNDSGRIVIWYLLHTDIDQRKQAEALLAGEKDLLELVAAGRPLPIVLNALCRFVEEITNGYCSVVLVDPSGARLEHGAAPSLPPSFLTSVIGRPVIVDSGPCAMAAYLNEQVIAADLTTETRWASYGWCPMALAHGLQACWSMPICSRAGQVLGAFAIYWDRPRTPAPRERALIDQVTRIVNIAIEREQSQASLTRAHDELKKSDGRLRTIIDAIPGFVWTATPDGGVDFLNQRWCDYTGLSMQDALGSHWQATVHPDDAGRLSAYWRSLLASGESGEFEARLRRFDGTFYWFLIRAVPLRDEVGHVVKWYGMNTEIEDRKRAESLLAGEKRLLEMVASDCSLTLILEALCKLVEAASGSYCSILLVDPSGTRLQHGAAPTLPASFNDSIHGLPLNAESGPCSMAAYLNKQVIAADITQDSRWETYPWCSLALAHGIKACWSTPISFMGGKILGVFAIYYAEPRTPTLQHQDLIGQITHIASIAIRRAQSEAALKRSEAFLAKTRRLTSTGGFSKHMATGEITWSEEVYRIFELDPTLPLTLDLILTRVHPEDISSFDELLNQQLAGGDYEHEYRLLMPDHSVKYLHVVAHASRDRDDQLEYVAAIQDVTQRRLSEKALAKAHLDLAHVARVTSLGALTASIAHEVNQPLLGIITNASTCLHMLAADPPNIRGALETARRTIRDGHRASDVITRLRALFSKKEITAELVDLNEASREVIALSLGELQRSRVILRSEFADNIPLVTGDRVQLQQVILNLLLNASDAMSVVVDRPRKLVIKTESDECDHVRVTVRDSGIGFEAQGADKLFEAFYTTKSGGMGIGLFVSRSIVENHQGRLWAVPNKGPGATFSFSIPRASQTPKSNHGVRPIRLPSFEQAMGNR
jgi:PAS domain S-box-containing protein